MNRLQSLAFAALLALPLGAVAAEPVAKIYRNPNCGCCDTYAEYLERNGFEVERIDSYDMAAVKTERNVPEALEGCHTMLLGPYVFEGLVPVDSVRRVLEERPFIKGLSLPGMPTGAPGMPGRKQQPLEVYVLGFGEDPEPTLYATYE